MTEQELVEKMVLSLYNRKRVKWKMRPVDYIGANKTPQCEECREEARAALSVIREALSEPSLQAEVDRLRVALARIEHECIIRQPATAVQTVKDVRAIAREAIALSYCVYNPIGEK